MIIDARFRRIFVASGLLAAMLGPSLVPFPASAQTGRDLAVETVPAPKPPRPSREPNVPVQASLISMGPTTLAVGSPIRFQVSSNRTGFGQVYVLNASGKVDLLVENLRLRPGQTVVIPRGRLTLRASAPTGDNTVVFVATRKRFPGFAGGQAVVVPTTLQVSASEFQGQLDTRLSIFERADWAVTKTIVRVTP